MWELLLDVLVLLTGAFVLGAIFERLRQSAILGYLTAGLLLGPNAFKLIKTDDVHAIAELGVALLLFGLGLEFSWRRLRQLGKRAIAGGILQMGATGAIVIGVAIAFGSNTNQAIALGAIIALSSTACVIRVLMDRSEVESVRGRSAIGILLMQDLALVPLAAVVTVLGQEGSAGGVAMALGQVALQALILIGVLFLILNKLAVRLLSSLTLARNRELAVLLAVVTGLGSAWAAHAADLSPALGAFVAGIFLGGSPFASQIRADIAPLRMVFLTLFFGAAGMLADPEWIIDKAGWVAATAVGVLVGKALVVWVVLRLVGLSNAHALATGLCLAQIGEFGFVLAALGLENKLLSEDVFLLITSTTMLTLLVTPYLVALAPRVVRWMNPDAADVTGHAPDGAPQVEVIVVGFGIAGQNVAEAQYHKQVPTAVIDLNPNLDRLTKPFGFPAIVGDATRVEILEHAGIHAARVVVITLPDPGAVRQVIRRVQAMAPQAHIVARSRYHIYRWEIEVAGAHHVVDEEHEVGHQLAAQVGAFFDACGPDEQPTDAAPEDRDETA